MTRPRAAAIAALALVLAGCGGAAPPPPPPPPDAGARDVGDPLRPGMGNGGYDVTSYDLSVAWDPDTREIDASAAIRLVSLQRLGRFNLDLLGLDVAEVTVDGVPAAVDRDGTELLVTPASPLPEGANAVVRVRYGGRPSPPINDGGWRDRGGSVVVFGQPESAATWFPVNDHPTDKAAYTIRLTVPADVHAAANGVLAARTPRPDGRVTWVYRQPAPQASYLTTVVIGRLETVPGGRTEAGIPVGNLVMEGVPEAARRDLGLQARMIDHFASLFGPYPFATYGAAVVTDLFGQALETQTLSVIDAAILEGPRGTDILAHEIVHQWIGNHVSVAGWRDLWVSEGWATYGEALWNASEDPGWDWDAWVRGVVAEYGDEIDGRAPLDPGPALFGASQYFRGALALHALRLEVGEAAFARIARGFVDRHGGGNASTEDFIALAEDEAGRDLGALFAAWVERPELPDRLGTLDLRDPAAPGTARPGPGPVPGTP